MTREDANYYLKSSGFSDEQIDTIAKAYTEPCDDEYIKVPKKALKYRTAGMVAYNAEWLKNHFDIERAVICGAQEPCEDAISRQIISDYVESHIQEINTGYGDLNKHTNEILRMIVDYIESMPSVNPQPCEDAISRQAAIKAITNTSGIRGDALNALYDLPPVNPQPKTGHWIFDEILDKHYYCSECKSMGVDYWDFCPSCGSYNGGNKDKRVL